MSDLKLGLLVRGIPMPHFAAADLLAAAWREVGVTTAQQRLNIWEWQKIVDRGDFDVALDFAGDFYDDPTIQLTKYVSHDLSPINFSGSQDRFLDALYIGQAMTTDQRERAKILRAFERHALTEAYTVPLLWWNRIVVTSSKAEGLAYHAQPFHRPGSGGCLAGAIARASATAGIFFTLCKAFDRHPQEDSDDIDAA